MFDRDSMRIALGEWWPRVAVIAVFLVVLLLPLLFGRDGDEQASKMSADPSLKLVIFTPHNEQIRYEFARAFNQWRQDNGLPEIYFDWRSAGGTSDLRRQVQDQFRRAALAGQEKEGIGYDLLFGGGDFEHNILAAGLTVERDGQPVHVEIMTPIHLPPEILHQVFPQDTIGGERLYQKDLKWVGVVLSAFGIVYNNDLLKMSGLPAPTTWSDLADSRYRQSLALADPAHSGSIAVTYNTILRRYGWSQGWDILRQCFANTRYFADSAGQVPIDVSQGQATAGMCIDFYGRFQAQAVGNHRVGYVNPPYMTTITADPIAIFQGAPHEALAQQFVLWLLSPDAQMLWQRKMGTPHGPEKFELRRMPIRRDIYTAENKQQWTDAIDPYSTARPFPQGMPDFYGTVAVISQAMAIDIHQHLVAAWQAILDHPNHPQYERMLELFYAMPPELMPAWPDPSFADNAKAALEDPSNPHHQETIKVLTDLSNQLWKRWKDPKRPNQPLRDRLAWTLFFQKNYREVVQIARQ